MIRLQAEPISIDPILQSVMSPARGGVAVFIGVVRNHHQDRKVHELDYDAHHALAEQELRKIADEVSARTGSEAIAIVHRTGPMVPGEIAVVVAASAAHRAEAFAGCRETIEALKVRVPIWKKEKFEGGEIWLEGGG